jgi:hypothetical protein
MAQVIQDLDQGNRDMILEKVNSALWSALQDLEVEFKEAEVTGIKIVILPEGHGAGSDDEEWCCFLDANNKLVCELC